VFTSGMGEIREQWYLNRTKQTRWLKLYFFLKWYSNKINSYRFIYSHSVLLISFIFDLSVKNLARTVRDLNGTKQKEQWMKGYFNGTIFPKIRVSPIPGSRYFTFKISPCPSFRRPGILKDIHKRFIMYQLLSATRYLHSGNVIHRDQGPTL
jgi:hypothetical protein